MPGVLEDWVFKASHLPTRSPTIDVLEMDLKEPYHGVKGKGLPAAQKAPKTSAEDSRGVMRTFTLLNYIISSCLPKSI